MSLPDDIHTYVVYGSIICATNLVAIERKTWLEYTMNTTVVNRVLCGTVVLTTSEVEFMSK